MLPSFHYDGELYFNMAREFAGKVIRVRSAENPQVWCAFGERLTMRTERHYRVTCANAQLHVEGVVDS
jgi:hypothetical protein